jgi:hypothetical protein
MYTKSIALLFPLAALLTGCAGPTQVLVSQRYAGERVVRYTIEPSGQATKETGQLYNLRVRICGVESSGTDSNCKDSMVLENVQPRSVY